MWYITNSWHGNTFHIVGPLWEETTCEVDSHHTQMASNAWALCFFAGNLNKPWKKKPICRRFESQWRHCNDTVPVWFLQDVFRGLLSDLHRCQHMSLRQHLILHPQEVLERGHASRRVDLRTFRVRQGPRGRKWDAQDLPRESTS